jgi:hypothetical protein
MRERRDRRRRQAYVAMVFPGHADHDVDRMPGNTSPR